MAEATPVSPSIRARIVHGALILCVVTFWALAWAVRERSLPAEALPDRRGLYIVLAVLSATSFGAAAFMVGRLRAPRVGATEDDWWQANLGRTIVVWALV